MEIEIRNDSVVIDGYVNVVERNSKVLYNKSGAFVEKVRAGVFQRALKRAKDSGKEVRVLLNHKDNRVLATTRDSSTVLKEDSVGLRCKCEIRDQEVVQKAKEGKLSGWSFGFVKNKDHWEPGEIRKRELLDIELREVSILDDEKTPAYSATSIEVRQEDELLEIRLMADDVQVTEDSRQKDNNFIEDYELQYRYLAARAGIK